jgi:hypothetical protein
MGFDGAGPERSSVPTWRGVLVTLLLVVVLIAVVYFAFSLAAADPRAPSA